MGQNYCSKNKVTKGRNKKTNQQKPSNNNKITFQKMAQFTYLHAHGALFYHPNRSDTLLKNKTNEYNKTESVSQRTS